MAFFAVLNLVAVPGAFCLFLLCGSGGRRRRRRRRSLMEVGFNWIGWGRRGSGAGLENPAIHTIELRSREPKVPTFLGFPPFSIKHPKTISASKM